MQKQTLPVAVTVISVVTIIWTVINSKASKDTNYCTVNIRRLTADPAVSLQISHFLSLQNQEGGKILI